MSRRKQKESLQAVSVQTMRESDAWTIAHKVPSKELMFRAGEGIFNAVEWKPPVAIVCGSGNNAGDGYVVADLLQSHGIDCTIILLAEKFSEDGAYYFERCREHGVPVLLFPETDEDFSLSQYATILDCILGTGFQGEVRGKAAAAIDAINASGAFVVSADINSGLNGDSGCGENYVCSDLTISIGDFKTGHFKGLAAIAMKEKKNVDIGIEIQGEKIPVTDPQKYLVFSDSHGRKNKVKKLLERHSDADGVIFLGDGEQDLSAALAESREPGDTEPEGITVYRVRGNCDRGSDETVTLVEEIGGKKFYLTHGFEQGVKYGLSKLRAYAKAEGCSIALFGHTHRAHLSEEDGVILFNPGSLANGDYGIILLNGEEFHAVHLKITEP